MQGACLRCAPRGGCHHKREADPVLALHRVHAASLRVGRQPRREVVPLAYDVSSFVMVQGLTENMQRAARPAAGRAEDAAYARGFDSDAVLRVRQETRDEGDAWDVQEARALAQPRTCGQVRFA